MEGDSSAAELFWQFLGGNATVKFRLLKILTKRLKHSETHLARMKIILPVVAVGGVLEVRQEESIRSRSIAATHR